MKKYSRVFTYLKQFKRSVVVYFVTILLSNLFAIISVALLFPFLQILFNQQQAAPSNNALMRYVTGQFTKLIQQGSPLNALGMVCILIIVSIFLKNFFLYISYRVMGPVKNRIVNNFRIELYNKIVRLPIGYFTERRKGDLLSRITTDVGELEGSVVGTLEGWIRDPMAIIMGLVSLFLINAKLTLIIVLCLPVMGLVIGRIGRSLKRRSVVVAQKSGEMLSAIDETLGGLRVIKAFNVEEKMRSKFYNINEDLVVGRNRVGFRKDLASPMSEFIGVMIFAGILWFGGRMVLEGNLMNGAIFLMYMGMFWTIIDPAKSISAAFSNMQKGSAAMDRIEEVLQASITVDDNPNGKTIETFNSAIEFKNVGFRYEDIEILKNINLKIEKGKTVAFVGSSGAGKSTLADLVPRFHDVSSGDIFVDGINIKDYSLQSLRNLISIVTQEPILFNDTIANNISLGMNNASQGAIEHAAKVANAHNFITQKEEGYSTNIGDRGSKLSGGERQRMTIARAVLKNPPILILDEATSSLDTESERLVQDAINNLMHHRTSIVIAHRLSTIRHADEIIVLQKGEIVERGTHDSLIAQNGYYKKLVEMQEVK